MAPKHTTLQVPPAVKGVLKSLQADAYAANPEEGVTAMGVFMAEALAEKFPQYADVLRKAGLID